MQPTGLMAVMTAILYSGRKPNGARNAPEATRDAQTQAVAEAWQPWHLTMEQWSDQGERHFEDPRLQP